MRLHKGVVNMKIIVVLTLLMGFLALPVFAATDWDEFESGRNNIRLEGYQGQPGYVEYQDGDGNVLGYVYWNETANEPYVITDDEFNKDYPLGVVTAGVSTNIGVALRNYTGSGLTP